MISGKPTLESMSIATDYNKWTLGLFEKYLKGEILEVGCGIGNFTKYLSQFGKVTAIDIEEEYIANLRKEEQNEITYKVTDISKNLPFADKKFNVIICINVLEHIKDDQKALENMYTLLKEGGVLILLVPAHMFLYGEIDKNIDHFRRYEESNLVDFLKEKGFIIERIRKLNMLGALGWFISGRILRERNVNEEKVKIFNLISPPFLALEKFIEPPFGTSLLVIASKD